MADNKYRDDDHFGRFEWREHTEEWSVLLKVPDHDEVTFAPTDEYFEDELVRDHIRKIVGIIVEKEAEFRALAVEEAYTDDWYGMFDWDNSMDRDQFFREMHLVHIGIERVGHDFGLWYEFAEGVEHAMLIFVSWDGLYQYARVA